jgi:hypothetical protein
MAAHRDPYASNSQGVNIRHVDKDALLYLARRDSHGQISPVVRKLINERMRTELGDDWEAQIIAESPDFAPSP